MVLDGEAGIACEAEVLLGTPQFPLSNHSSSLILLAPYLGQHYFVAGLNDRKCPSFGSVLLPHSHLVFAGRFHFFEGRYTNPCY